MPLKPGSSSSVISDNIHELMLAWETTGEINGDKIRTKKEALNRAIAIAMSNAHPKKPKKDKNS